MSQYSVVFMPEPEGGYSVLVPALPECHTQGETFEEALANAREAIELCLEGRCADGEAIPIERDAASLVRVAVDVPAERAIAD
jgi:antitoxin HicB